jgi:uncharacterized protein YndB with AHSA1/START domain
MKDLIDELGLAQRGVTAGQLPAGDARVVTLSRRYQADVEDVWDAITTPERIARWFLPVSGDLREGGTYQLEGNAGGEIRVCDPPRHLLLTWIFGEPPGPEDSSMVGVRLAPDDAGGTVLTLEHVAVFPPEMWDRYGPGAVGVGWDLALIGLAAHLAGVELGDPATLESEPAMRACMTASAEAWGAALRASGADDETVARTTAETTAFYVPPVD